MPTVSSSAPSRPLSPDAIAASQALASRERQNAHDRKKAASKTISLAGPVLGAGGKPADLNVLGRRADTRVANRREAEAKQAMYGGELDKRIRVADEFEDATPEQIARARAHGAVGVVAGVRRLVDPFTSLSGRGSLHDNDQVGEALFQAGIRYRMTVRTAGLDGAAKAMDLTKDIVDGGEPMSGMAISERVASARKTIREATAAVAAASPNLVQVLDAIVVQDQTIEQAGIMVSGERARAQRYVFTLGRLKEALTILAHHWDMMPRSGPRPFTACGADGVRFYEGKRKKIA